MKIKLTDLEVSLCQTVEVEDAIYSLGMDAEKAADTFDGSRKGAEYVVAKFFNLYPFPATPSGGYLITRSKKKLAVLWSKVAKAAYAIKKSQEDADLYIVVVGRVPRLELVGFAYRDKVISSKPLTILSHILNPIPEEWGYNEIVAPDPFRSL
jgi:hypothetical protein